MCYAHFNKQPFCFATKSILQGGAYPFKATNRLVPPRRMGLVYETIRA